MQSIVPTETNPNCQTSKTWYPVMEGAKMTFSCSVMYDGKWAPTMSCRNDTRVLRLKNESSGNTVKFSGEVTLTRWDYGKIYSCRTFFDRPKQGETTDQEANNIPFNNGSYIETFTLPRIWVHCEY